MLYQHFMETNIAIIGFGVIGTEVLSKICESYKNKKKKLNILIVEKNLKNIPGGEAYSEYQSKYGFFNNPLRISNPEFVRWLKDKKNNKKLCNISLEKKYNLDNWLKLNNFFCEKKISKFDELYVPRFFYSIFLQEKIFKSLKNLKKNIKVTFLNGEIKEIENEKINHCYFKNNANKYSYFFRNKKIIFKKINFKFKSFKSENIILGTGVLPPQKINIEEKISNKNYIDDFYGSRGTFNLINKINNKLKNKKKIKIIFIGNKAGLLEAMPELQKLTLRFKKRIKITCISPSSITLEKAELSRNYQNFELVLPKNFKNKDVNKAHDLYRYIVKEFKNGTKNGFNKYDVWTSILKKRILNKMYKSLSGKEKIKYNENVFTKIRNITRYTYPHTVDAKEKLEDDKILKFIIGRVLKINEIKKKLFVISEKKQKIFGDIIINVSGPTNLKKANTSLNYLESLKKISQNFNSRAFFTNNSFMLKNNIYMPGTLSLNFNPNRLTIIRAITRNAHKVAINISKKYNKKNYD